MSSTNNTNSDLSPYATKSELSSKANSSDLNNYYPKSGGAITGTAIRRSTNDNHLEITGGTDYNSAPSLVLTPYNSTEGWQPQGSFLLHTNNFDLMGKSDGTLTWGGKQVAVSGDYLPLSGGNMTGEFIQKSNDNGRIGLISGTAGGNGASITLCGKDHGLSGQFYLEASDGHGTSSVLTGTPAGSLTWDGKQVAVSGDYLPLSGGNMTGRFIGTTTNNGRISLMASNLEGRGAILTLCGKDYDLPGEFYLDAIDNTQQQYIHGKPDGTLTWGPEGHRKPIDCIEEQGDEYIRYSSGLQICWGLAQDLETGTKAYPKPFRANTYVSIVGNYIGGGASKILHFANIDGVNFRYEKTPGVWADWHAIGKWK